MCIFESGSGGLINAGMTLGRPIFLFALMPFVRPFCWSYLVFTYLIPFTTPVTTLGRNRFISTGLFTGSDGDDD